MDKRIKDDHVSVDYSKIEKFFQDRGGNNLLPNKYNYVLFQDNNPD